MIKEPWAIVNIIVSKANIGNIMTLCQNRRGIQVNLSYIDNSAWIAYEMPLSEIIFDFYDKLKSISQGYASFDYKIIDYRSENIVKMSILINHEYIDALSMLIHRDQARYKGKIIIKKLKNLIPRHMFPIPIQAAINNKIVARETISALRKDVTSKCYGRDTSRKLKLLNKQKIGKKKLSQFGKVKIPQEAFIKALKI